jgi:Lon protease-like protein
MLPPLIPIFPLPNVVLFPNVFLPLHVFEPRYCDMVRDALAGDRMIGMVLLKPGSEDDYEGRPEVYPVGCAGLITHVDRPADGQYNIILRGLEKFRIVHEEPGFSYRRVHIEPLLEVLVEADRDAVRRERRRLEALLSAPIEPLGLDSKLPGSMPDEDLVNALAQYLDLEPIERQALLEREGLLARAHALVNLLEMKTLMSNADWSGSGIWQ